MVSSPLRRAVLTAKIALENHPNKANQEWKIIPWIRETMKSNCDIAISTHKLKEQYPDLDIEDIYKDDQFWCLQYYKPLDAETTTHEDAIKATKHRNAILAALEEKKDIQVVLDYMAKINPERIEAPYQAHLRVLEAKKALGEYIRGLEAEGKEVKDLELLVVAHSNFLRYFTCESIDEKGDPVGYTYFQNAEINEFDFEY